MIELKKFKEESIEINWLTIILGWYGPGKNIKLLDNKDIIEYATNLIIEKDNQEEQVLMLASCREQDSEEIDIILNKLVCNSVTLMEVEEKKWIVIMLKDLLAKISSNPIQGLVQITSFWEKFNYPSYSPHILQGVNNNIQPEEYYSEKNYNKIIEIHRIWIKNQLKELKNQK